MSLALPSGFQPKPVAQEPLASEPQQPEPGMSGTQPSQPGSDDDFERVQVRTGPFIMIEWSTLVLL